MSKLPKVSLAVRNVGIYKAPRNLPNVNQPDVLNIENYLGSPFYSYMFVTSRKKVEDLRDEEIQEMLSGEENVNFYIEKMSYDLKLQKVSMGAILLKNTYVHFKQMRKFIWQHNHPEKVIVKHRDDFLPDFKRLLSRFILMNYCAMNTPDLSGAEWIPEKHAKKTFDFVNAKYKQELGNFEWMGQNCRLRHPNPLNAHPKVNFSAFTDDMSDGRIFFLDISKYELKDAINVANAQIFELLSKYLGTLAIPPSDEQLEAEGINIEMETPSVFDIIEEKPMQGDKLVTETLISGEAADVIAAEKFAEEEQSRAREAAARKSRGESVKGTGRRSGASAVNRKKTLKAHTLEAFTTTTQTDEPAEFYDQKEKIEKGNAKVLGNEIMAELTDVDFEKLRGDLATNLGQHRLDINSLDDPISKLSDALLNSGLYSNADGAGKAATLIIARGLAGKTLNTKTKGLISFARGASAGDLKLSGNSAYRKGGFSNLVARLVKLQTKKGAVDLSSVYGMI